MKTFVVGYISFFDNILTLHKVEAVSETEAMIKILGNQGWETDELDVSDAEAIKQFAFDGDCMVNAIEI